MTITINGHSWKRRVAIMRGRHLLGEHVPAIESAKQPETRRRGIEQAVATPRDRESAGAARPAPGSGHRR